jgi:hypothetical protein
MPSPFWQQSLETLTFADLKAFIDLGTPEGDSLEYKRASLNTKNAKKYEFDAGFLKTALNDLNTLAQQALIDVGGTTRDRRWVLRHDPPVG